MSFGPHDDKLPLGHVVPHEMLGEVAPSEPRAEERVLEFDIDVLIAD